MKKHPNRIEATFSDSLWSKLEELETKFGTKRQVIRVAVDLLSKTEKPL